jgi:flagella basal body P-ring formation protein FlgA
MMEMMRVSKLFLALVLMVAGSTGVRAATQSTTSVEAQFVSRLKQAFATKMEMPAESFDVRTENLTFFPAVSPETLSGAEILDVMGLGTAGASRIDGLFAMSVTIKYPDHSVREHQISGLMHVTGPVWVSKEILNRGRVLTANDIELIRLPWSQLATGVALTRKDDLVGRAVRKYLARGTPLFGTVLETAASVNMGDTVELTVQSGPGVMIRSRAVAKQSGRVGEFIRVEQSDTRKPLQALVTGEKSVEVNL